MFHRWNNIPLELTIEITKISPDDLPTLIGINNTLDKSIAEILRNIQEKYYWYFYRGIDIHLLSPKLTVLVNQIAHKDADVGNINIEAHSSGYYDSGSVSGPADNWYPEEGDDERIVQKVKFSFYNNGNLLTVCEKENDMLSDLTAKEFDTEIYDIELPESVHEYDGGDIDHYYDMYKEGLI